MNDQNSPTVRAWELGIRLREHREQLGVTSVLAAKGAKCTQGYISGVEAGKFKLTAAKLAQIMAVYEIDDAEKAELEQLRTEASQRAWWHKYSPLLSNDFKRFLGYEAGAEHNRAYDGELVHGLLQTEEYARAIIHAGYPFTRLTEMERRVQLRRERRARLEGSNPLRLTALMSEAALRYQIGGPQVMRDQLDHLSRTAEADHVDIRIIPFTMGAHPAIGASFQILSFSSPYLPDLVWQEVVTSTAIIERPPLVTEYAVTFAKTMETALDATDSLSLIRDVAKEMR